MKYFLSIALMVFTLNSSFANVCNDLDNEFQRTQRELDYHQDIVTMYAELASDAKRTSRTSKGMAASSATVLFLSPLGRGLKFAGGKLVSMTNMSKGYIQFLKAKLGARPLGITLGALTTLVSSLYISYDGELEIESITQSIETYDAALAELEEQKTRIDLNWTPLQNALTLGGKAASQTEKLYKNAENKDKLLRSKLALIQEIRAVSICSK